MKSGRHCTDVLHTLSNAEDTSESRPGGLCPRCAGLLGTTARHRLLLLEK
ncbi:MAG: hypothetical protein GY778_05975 [bacterium]|nr:hypothetical protein [bacterium]